jgi:hypothetical protein
LATPVVERPAAQENQNTPPAETYSPATSKTKARRSQTAATTEIAQTTDAEIAGTDKMKSSSPDKLVEANRHKDKRSKLGYVVLLTMTLMFVVNTNATAEPGSATAPGTDGDSTNAAESHGVSFVPGVETDLSNSIVETPAGDKLLELAQKQFPNGISASETNLFLGVASGDGFEYYRTRSKIEDEPTNSEVWPESRVIRADRLAWLCKDPDASKLVTSRGIEIEGIRIINELDLSEDSIAFPLSMSRCAFPEGIRLWKSHLNTLDLRGTWVNRTFMARGLKVDGDLYLGNDFQLNGCLQLRGATIGGELNCGGGRFYSLIDDDFAIDAEQAKIDGGVTMMKVETVGRVEFGGATIGQGLVLIESHLAGSRVFWALDAEKADIEGDVTFIGTTIDGQVDFSFAKIKGLITCSDARFFNANSETYALTAPHAEIGGITFDGKCKITGGMLLYGAIINGDMILNGGQFVNTDTNKDALSVESAEIKGSLFLEKQIQVDGTFNLAGANIEHLLAVDVTNSMGNVLMDLRSTKVGVLLDDSNSWPAANHLLLNNFAYDQIDDPLDWKSRIKWLQLQPNKDYLPQPYVQLAEYFRKTGHDVEAAQVMIAKNDNYAGHLPWYSLSHLWYSVIGKLVGYGYKTGRAFGLSLVFIIVGTLVFRFGHRRDLILPSDDKVYSFHGDELKVKKSHPVFNPFIYSLEMFVPLVKLGMDEYWRPNAERGRPLYRTRKRTLLTTDGLLRCYLWIHILAGWVLTTLWVGGLTGLVKT